MDAMECMLTRRSVRKFTEDPVIRADLEKILEAVRYSPSWENTQCWELVLVRDADQKQRLQEAIPGNNPARKGLLQAPVVIALCARRGRAGGKPEAYMSGYGDWFMFDAGIAAQNLCLAAWALGYGTVNVGWLDHAAGAKVLGLPDDVALLELIPLGRPAKQPKTPRRREIPEFVHQERYGS
jgi:nitroreductase